MHQRLTSNEQKEISDDIVVSVKNVSKKFCKNLKRSMAYGIVDLSKNLMGIKPDSTSIRGDEFWAVNDVSFEVKRGEVLGLIGVNGSGKTTLLRLLSGIFPPDMGEISIKGRVGALVSVGAGFHPYMTGRENIYLNGTILGMNREELDSKFQSIVDFAEIGDFLDAPVSTYSSGMRVRLGFAIAAQIEPDLMLIDEVLAVGDVGFRAKCFNVIAKISSKSAIIIVSHQMPQIAKVCTKLMLLHAGKMVFYDSNVVKGIEKYHSLFNTEKGVVTGSGDAELLDFQFQSNGGHILDSIAYLDELVLTMDFRIKKSVKDPLIYVTFLNQSLQGVANCSSKIDKYTISNKTGFVRIKLRIPEVTLNPGIYLVSVGVQESDPFRILKQYFAYKKLVVMGDFVSVAPVQLKGEWLAN